MKTGKRFIGVLLSLIMIMSLCVSFASVTAMAAPIKQTYTVIPPQPKPKGIEGRSTCYGMAPNTITYDGTRSQTTKYKSYEMKTQVNLIKGGVRKADCLKLTSSGAQFSKFATVRYMRATIITTDNKKHEKTLKLELIKGNTRITEYTDGKRTQYKTEKGVIAFNSTYTLSVNGTIWKAAKSIDATVNATGGKISNNGLYIYYKGKF